MPVIINNISSPISSDNNEIIQYALKKSGIKKDDIKNIKIHKTSLDARKQNNMKFVSSVYIELKESKNEKIFCEHHDGCTFIENKKISFTMGKEKPEGKIVIAGFGPAGMFSALFLAENGYRPTVVERGEKVEDRIRSVERFWNETVLNVNSNVQFGEGGAGTFSDGKLTTRIHDPLCSYILKKFVEFGAPEEILTKAKPHIGTDNLRKIVKNIREKIISLGGEIYFNTALKDIFVSNGKVTKAVTDKECIDVSALIIAPGHSARDTFSMLFEKGVFMEPKPFSIGARIEHRQEEINKSLYGKYYDNPQLPAGEYQLSYRTKDRCVYTFCMCPGGIVVPSSSEHDTIVTNGMSEFARDGENANSALVVSVSPKDFGNNPLDGISFARQIEHKAFLSTGKTYKAPAVSVGRFLDKSFGYADSTITPTFACGISEADFNEIFPHHITDMMRTGIRIFSGKISAFSDKTALLTAPETRTSSPVRITRNDSRQSVSVNGLYPCGEGAGYAGGIMSAAADGLHTAITVAEKFSIPD